MTPASTQSTADHVVSPRHFPESTYRLQFHKDFTFRDAAAIAPYLRELGITHLYASPYLAARPGSTHGYDVIDHCRLNPELGGDEGFAIFLDALKHNGLEHILDTVPNHVGVGTNDNAWWNDVLENGPASIYGAYFDIAWRASPRPELHDKVLIPTLGSPYADVLERGEFKLSFDASTGSFAVNYYDRRFPISPRTYGRILGHDIDGLTRQLDARDPGLMELLSILTAARNLPDRSDNTPDAIAERHREKEVIKYRIAGLTARNVTIRRFIERNVATFNGRAGDARSFDPLDDLLEHQCYRLSYWHVASDEINYRRFFDINDLAALSMEREEVFLATHKLILQLLAEGKIAGLRIDHPDGLYDPKQYLERLYRSVQPPPYVVVEKILAPDELLPHDWPVQGTTGYDFLNQLNGLFIDCSAEPVFTKLYNDWTGRRADFEDLVYRKKLLVLDTALSSELHMLAHQLDRLAQRDRRSRDFTLNGLIHALKQVIACFPVYRSYISASEGVHPSDAAHVERAIERAIAQNPKTSASIFHFIRDTILQKYPESFIDADRADQLRFAGKFQQVTAPVTAKGVEDTAFYIYNRFVSLNEVGGEPAHFGVAPDRLHEYFLDRQKRWPCAVSALSTHDTKRSEDVRARLNVLSEVPDEWRTRVHEWRALTAEPASAHQAPDENEQYLLYQTLVGAYPLDLKHDNTFIQRIQAYMQKAMREAKVHTTWTDLNQDHESAVNDFIARILGERTGRAFLDSFRPFVGRVARHGLLNSLAQTLIKLAAPGVPDTYQGTELWDFSLVDPDNRRPVDYERRRQMLRDVDDTDPRKLVETMEDGRAKLFVTTRALVARRERPDLFTAGEYLPVRVEGERAAHVFAFARRHEGRVALCVVPRLTVALTSGERPVPVGMEVWGQTRLVMPEEVRGTMRDAFTGARVNAREVRVGDVLGSFPVALLVND